MKDLGVTKSIMFRQYVTALRSGPDACHSCRFAKQELCGIKVLPCDEIKINIIDYEEGSLKREMIIPAGTQCGDLVAFCSFLFRKDSAVCMLLPKLDMGVSPISGGVVEKGANYYMLYARKKGTQLATLPIFEKASEILGRTFTLTPDSCTCFAHRYVSVKMSPEGMCEVRSQCDKHRTTTDPAADVTIACQSEGFIAHCRTGVFYPERLIATQCKHCHHYAVFREPGAIFIA